MTEPDAERPDVIVSERLELPLLTPQQLRAAAQHDAGPLERAWNATVSEAWLDDVAWLAERRLAQVGEHPDHAPWLLRAVVTRTPERVAIGHINFHAPPDELAVPEIGYGLLPAYHRQGYGVESVRAMLEWARAEHGVRRFRASVSPDNERSLHLIGKLGFERIGEQWDEEDGLEWVFETPETPA
jgi:RimJ/RimL family protein N-acetyltransferase